MSKRKPSSSSIRPASTASRRRFPCFSSPYHFSKSPHSPLGASRRPASLRSTSAQPVKMFFTSTRVGCGAAFKREGGWEKETAEGLRFGTQGSCLQCLERGILSHARNEGMSQEFRSCGLGHMFGFSA